MSDQDVERHEAPLIAVRHPRRGRGKAHRPVFTGQFGAASNSYGEITVCGAPIRPLTERLPIDQVAPETQCRRCWPSSAAEHADPRDFADLAVRAADYFDFGDVDRARTVLAQIPIARLRQLGEYYDRLSMICFDLAGPMHHDADDAVDPAAFRTGPDSGGITEHPPGWPPVNDYPLPPPPSAPVIGFEVHDLDELATADTSEKNPS